MKNTFCISRNQFSVREDTNQDGVSASLNFNENEITNTSFCTVRTWECLHVLYVLHGVLCVLHTYMCLCTIRTLESESVLPTLGVCLCMHTLLHFSVFYTLQRACLYTDFMECFCMSRTRQCVTHITWGVSVYVLHVFPWMHSSYSISVCITYTLCVCIHYKHLIDLYQKFR